MYKFVFVIIIIFGTHRHTRIAAYVKHLPLALSNLAMVIYIQNAIFFLGDVASTVNTLLLLDLPILLQQQQQHQ